MSFNSIEKFGETIKIRRKLLKITQPDLAQMAGISVNTLYKIERGVGNPTFKVVDKLLGILGLQLSVDVRPIEYQ